MLFTFKRDEEGRERIYVGDTPFVITMGRDEWTLRASPPAGVNVYHIHEAIERADEAGLWDGRAVDPVNPWDVTNGRIAINEVIVDVPVAETSTTLVVVSEGDE